ncbi:hypothetical protein CBR_g41410 [Chara braunii]|uniref:DUF659 domain-containing protein n=1 Tax=Chara braunii TaxID=69332 RepID=A0A388LVR1_CHABU|nr:hypothetical protein CBR_g41410 [Chara braunii]|eukprot:GBG86414.1 hypothetical protein CBR_g41410 [Chara braunii]
MSAHAAYVRHGQLGRNVRPAFHGGGEQAIEVQRGALCVQKPPRGHRDDDDVASHGRPIANGVGSRPPPLFVSALYRWNSATHRGSLCLRTHCRSYCYHPVFSSSPSAIPQHSHHPKRHGHKRLSQDVRRRHPPPQDPLIPCGGYHNPNDRLLCSCVCDFMLIGLRIRNPSVRSSFDVSAGSGSGAGCVDGRASSRIPAHAHLLSCPSSRMTVVCDDSGGWIWRVRFPAPRRRPMTSAQFPARKWPSHCLRSRPPGRRWREAELPVVGRSARVTSATTSSTGVRRHVCRALQLVDQLAMADYGLRLSSYSWDCRWAAPGAWSCDCHQRVKAACHALDGDGLGLGGEPRGGDTGTSAGDHLDPDHREAAATSRSAAVDGVLEGSPPILEELSQGFPQGAGGDFDHHGDDDDTSDGFVARVDGSSGSISSGLEKHAMRLTDVAGSLSGSRSAAASSLHGIGETRAEGSGKDEEEVGAGREEESGSDFNHVSRQGSRRKRGRREGRANRSNGQQQLSCTRGLPVLQQFLEREDHRDFNSIELNHFIDWLEKLVDQRMADDPVFRQRDLICHILRTYSGQLRELEEAVEEARKKFSACKNAKAIRELSREIKRCVQAKGGLLKFLAEARSMGLIPPPNPQDHPASLPSSPSGSSLSSRLSSQSTIPLPSPASRAINIRPGRRSSTLLPKDELRRTDPTAESNDESNLEDPLLGDTGESTTQPSDHSSMLQMQVQDESQSDRDRSDSILLDNAEGGVKKSGELEEGRRRMPSDSVDKYVRRERGSGPDLHAETDVASGIPSAVYQDDVAAIGRANAAQSADNANEANEGNKAPMTDETQQANEGRDVLMTYETQQAFPDKLGRRHFEDERRAGAVSLSPSVGEEDRPRPENGDDIPETATASSVGSRGNTFVDTAVDQVRSSQAGHGARDRLQEDWVPPLAEVDDSDALAQKQFRRLKRRCEAAQRKLARMELVLPELEFMYEELSKRTPELQVRGGDGAGGGGSIEMVPRGFCWRRGTEEDAGILSNVTLGMAVGEVDKMPNDKNTKYLLRNHKGGEAESDVHRGDASHGEEGLEDPQTDEPQPPPVAGRAVAGIANMLADALDEAVDAGGAAEGGGGEEGQGAGIAFNFLNMDTTQTLHAVYLEVANARPKVKLPSYNYMRTVMLDIIYLKIHKEVNPMTRCWDSTGCTFITDGSTDRKNRPVMNFLAAGEQGAVLVTVTMSGRKKNAVALAKLWEQVMREIGLQRINAICTDNAEVNKKAAQILEWCKDKDVARIPWVPCGAHCCSLLLKDLANLSWIKGTVKTANTIWRALRWSGEKLRRRANLVYYTVRSEAWWSQVRKIVDIMHPIFQLLKRMDAEGTPPTNLVEYDDMIRRKLTNVVLTQKEREDVMEKVRDRVQMMRQPVHAAAFVLDPRRWNERWLFDQNSAVMQNAMRYFLRQIGGEWNSEEHSDLWAELMEFQKEPARVATEEVCTEPGKAMKKRKDEHMWKQPAVDDVRRLNPATWWAAHGGDVPTLQAIAIKILLGWLTGNQDCYDAATFKNKKYLEGHFDRDAVHWEHGRQYVFSQESFQRFKQDPSHRLFMNGLYFAVNMSQGAGVMTGLDSRALNLIAAKVSGDTRFRPRLLDQNTEYLSQLLEWSKGRIRCTMNTKQVLTLYAARREWADQVLFVQIEGGGKRSAMRSQASAVATDLSGSTSGPGDVSVGLANGEVKPEEDILSGDGGRGMDTEEVEDKQQQEGRV